MKEKGRQQREAGGDSDPEQAHQKDCDGPLDAIPREGSDGVFAPNRQAEIEILRAVGIERMQGAACAAIEKLQTGGIVEAGCTQGERRRPQEEI